jgi:hypothetical protein
MRHVKRYQELFESQIELSQEQTEWLDKCTDGTWTLNPQTGLVDVSGSFNCSGQNLTDFKGARFGVVTGDFNCSLNKLTSLKDAPKKVELGFHCDNNELTSLKGAPQTVGGDFFCYNNKLTSLEGAPSRVGGGFYCHNNKITSLVGAPKQVIKNFYSPNNPVSDNALTLLYRMMQSGMSWPDAVAEEWDSIESEEDKMLLAPYHPDPTSEDVKVYQAIARLRKRVI